MRGVTAHSFFAFNHVDHFWTLLNLIGAVKVYWGYLNPVRGYLKEVFGSENNILFKLKEKTAISSKADFLCF